jgi:hypothetical protein
LGTFFLPSAAFIVFSFFFFFFNSSSLPALFPHHSDPFCPPHFQAPTFRLGQPPNPPSTFNFAFLTGPSSPITAVSIAFVTAISPFLWQLLLPHEIDQPEEVGIDMNSSEERMSVLRAFVGAGHALEKACEVGALHVLFVFLFCSFWFWFLLFLLLFVCVIFLYFI